MNKKSISSKHDSSIDQAYDGLLLDEKFQEFRAEILRSIPRKQQNLLRQTDKVYLANKGTPKKIDRSIRKEYNQHIKKINKNRKKHRNKFNFSIIFDYPLFAGGGFIAAGLALGIIGSIFLAHNDESSQTYQAADTHKNIEIINSKKKEPRDLPKELIDSSQPNYELANDGSSDFNELPKIDEKDKSDVELASDKKKVTNE